MPSHFIEREMKSASEVVQEKEVKNGRQKEGESDEMMHDRNIKNIVSIMFFTHE